MATLFPSFRRRPESSHKWNHSSIAKATSGYPLRGNIFIALDSGLRRNDTPQDLQRAQRGFTLIELLVALVILVLLSMAGYRGLDAVLQARERVATETRKWQHLAFFFARVDQDIAQAVSRTVRDQGGISQPEWIGHNVVVDENDASLLFTRAGIPGQGEEMQAPQRIGYRLEQGNIVMLRWRVLDQPPRVEPVRYPLLEGVREFKLRYLDSAGNWLAQWPPAGQVTGLPTGVEMELVLVSGEKITRMFALQ